MRISGGTGEVREGCRGWRLTSDRVIELARLVASCGRVAQSTEVVWTLRRGNAVVFNLE